MQVDKARRLATRLDIEEQKLYADACRGLQDGSLEELGRYVVSGAPIFGYLAELLLDAACGEGNYKLELKNAKKGGRPLSYRIDTYGRKQAIGIEAISLLNREGDGCFEAVISEVMARHSVSRAMVTNAVAMVRRELAGEYGEFANLAALEDAFPAHKASLGSESTLYTIKLDRLRADGQENMSN